MFASDLAVSFCLGVSFDSVTEFADSALYRCIPPTPNIGRTATAKTTISFPGKDGKIASKEETYTGTLEELEKRNLLKKRTFQKKVQRK